MSGQVEISTEIPSELFDFRIEYKWNAFVNSFLSLTSKGRYSIHHTVERALCLESQIPILWTMQQVFSEFA